MERVTGNGLFHRIEVGVRSRDNLAPLNQAKYPKKAREIRHKHFFCCVIHGLHYYGVVTVPVTVTAKTPQESPLRSGKCLLSERSRRSSTYPSPPSRAPSTTTPKSTPTPALESSRPPMRLVISTPSAGESQPS